MGWFSDRLIECPYCDGEGETYSWTGGRNSRNVPDGSPRYKTTYHCNACDGSGEINESEGKERLQEKWGRDWKKHRKYVD